MARYTISDAEWRVLQALWKGHPASAEEVVNRLRGKADWQPRTVKTLLHRLVAKRVLSFRRDGRRYLYAPRATREACVRRASRSFLEKVFGGAAGPAILHLVEEARLSPEEIEELRKVLSERAERKGGLK